MAQEEAFVVSDLHLGAGDADPELEDFDQDDTFAEFVGQIAGPGVTLFLNGDFIDFAQIPPYDVPQPHHLLWTEAASAGKGPTCDRRPCSDLLGPGRIPGEGWGAVPPHRQS